MMYRFLSVGVMLWLLAVPCSGAAADDTAVQPAVKAKQAGQETIYGSQLMTHQERMEHRAKLRAAKTLEEREQIRKEHHEKMQARAKERGVSLPDMPSMPGGGMGRPGGVMPGPKR
jgi:hypothetical protein